MMLRNRVLGVILGPKRSSECLGLLDTGDGAANRIETEKYSTKRQILHLVRVELTTFAYLMQTISIRSLGSI